MDEKLKSENMQKRAVFYVYVIFREQSGQAGVENGAIKIYFRMHHFVVKFSSLQAARGHQLPLTTILWTFLLSRVKYRVGEKSQLLILSEYVNKTENVGGM